MTTSVIDTHLPETVFVPAEGIDFELGYRSFIDGQTAWEWTSCGPTFSDDYSSDETFSSQAAAIQDAITFLTGIYNEPVDLSALESVSTSLNLTLSEISPYECGVHFALCIYEDREGVYWRGLCQEPGEAARWWGEGDFSEYASDRGYVSEKAAAAAAIYCFHRLREHSATDTLTLCYELGLPMEQIIEEHFLTLTVSQASGYGSAAGDIDAMSLEAKKEACIDRSEAAAFMSECQGWQSIALTYDNGTTFTHADRYEEGYGVVLQIDIDDWAKWLAGYEIVEDIDPKHVAAYLAS